MRDHITTAAELTGLALVSAGCFLIAAPAGLIAAGLSLLLVGAMEGR